MGAGTKGIGQYGRDNGARILYTVPQSSVTCLQKMFERNPNEQRRLCIYIQLEKQIIRTIKCHKTLPLLLEIAHRTELQIN